MCDAKRIIGVTRRAVAVLLVAMSLATVLSCGAFATEQAAASPKVRELATLLAVELLKEQGASKPVPAAAAQETDDVGSLSIEAIHDQIISLARAIPDLPHEFERAVVRITMIDADLDQPEFLLNLGIFGDRYYFATRRLAAEARALLTLAMFGAFGFAAQWLFRKTTGGVRRRLDRLPMATVKDRLRVIGVRFALAFGVIAALVLGCLGPLLVLYWDPVRRLTALNLLVAVVATWVAIATGDVLLAPNDEHFRIVPMNTAAARFWCRRLTVVVGWFAFVWVMIGECSILGFTYQGVQLVGYTLGLGTVAIALESIWRQPVALREIVTASSADRRNFGRSAANIARSIGVVLLWVFWVVAPGIWAVMPAFWLVLVLIALPPAISAGLRTVDNLLRPPGSPRTGGPPSVIEASLEHGIRALLIIAAAALVGWGWNIDLVHLAGHDTLSARIVHGVLTTVVILLIADVLWSAAGAAIDRKLAETAELGEPNSDEARRRARLRTLLPIFRNVLFVLVIAIAAMMALAELGVEIGPLIAGASVVGVAIGFGAQTFVRDVIAGMFYLLDDAFRVGEYIQAGRYKGTVEGFSIRSIKLRHHRGPVFTVPFSLLGAVENMSRDWVIDKIAIGVTYDSDLNLAKKLIKQIGLDLAKNPAFAPLIIEPLKMQGVDALGDFAVQIRAKMMTQPGEQFVIRRQAYAMIKKAFDENGIKFAFPTVQVAGESEAASAAVAQRALELIRAPAAE
jgi:moderate conductance mechanosensitive channel